MNHAYLEEAPMAVTAETAEEFERDMRPVYTYLDTLTDVERDRVIELPLEGWWMDDVSTPGAACLVKCALGLEESSRAVYTMLDNGGLARRAASVYDQNKVAYGLERVVVAIKAHIARSNPVLTVPTTTGGAREHEVAARGA